MRGCGMKKVLQGREGKGGGHDTSGGSFNCVALEFWRVGEGEEGEEKREGEGGRERRAFLLQEWR